MINNQTAEVMERRQNPISDVLKGDEEPLRDLQKVEVS